MKGKELSKRVRGREKGRTNNGNLGKAFDSTSPVVLCLVNKGFECGGGDVGAEVISIARCRTDASTSVEIKVGLLRTIVDFRRSLALPLFDLFHIICRFAK